MRRPYVYEGPALWAWRDMEQRAGADHVSAPRCGSCVRASAAPGSRSGDARSARPRVREARRGSCAGASPPRPRHLSRGVARSGPHDGSGLGGCKQEMIAVCRCGRKPITYHAHWRATPDHPCPGDGAAERMSAQGADYAPSVNEDPGARYLIFFDSILLNQPAPAVAGQDDRASSSRHSGSASVARCVRCVEEVP